MRQSGSPRRSGRLAARGRQVKPRTRPRTLSREEKNPEMNTTSSSPRKTGITDLPPELRELVVRNLIHSVNGPEVYVGIGSFTAVQVVASNIIYLLPHFHSSVTDTLEMCVAVPEIVIHRHTATPLETWRKVANRKLTEYSGHTWGNSYLPGQLEQTWAVAYRKLRPLMACKTLYYEATAVFFREKHFVLGSSTYAHEWLRRIGQRNQVNLRNIRLKIHRELSATGNLNTSGSQWIEVLKKVGRSARQLKVLGFQFDQDDDLWRSPLLKTFLRMKNFQNLKQIDFLHFFDPQPLESREFLAMVTASTGCPLVRCLKCCSTWYLRFNLAREAFIDDEEQIHVSADIEAEV